jgi:VanZ family protein
MRLAIRTSLPTLLRIGAWGCVVILAVLSLLPANELWRTGLARLGYGTQMEHFIAYCGATICIGLAYPARPGRRLLALALIAYAGVLEIAQLHAAARNASLLDFAASTAGVVAGAILIPAAGRSLVRMLAGTPAAPPARRDS